MCLVKTETTEKGCLAAKSVHRTLLYNTIAARPIKRRRREPKRLLHPLRTSALCCTVVGRKGEEIVIIVRLG